MRVNFIAYNYSSHTPKVNQHLPTQNRSNLPLNVSPSFTGFHCSSANFVLKNLENIPCANCGDIMLPHKIANNFVNEVTDLTGNVLIQKLIQYINYFKLLEKNIAKSIIKEAPKNRDKNLQELVKISAEKYKPLLEERQISILHRIKEVSQRLDNEQSVKNINSFINYSILLIKNSDDTKFFTRGEFIENLYNILPQKNSVELKSKITTLANELPSSTNSMGSFLIKYSRKTPKEIAQMLVAPSISTTEHIKPALLGGKGNTANYLVECARCNSSRNHTSLYRWLKLSPQMAENMQKYLNVITKRILSGEITKLDDYPQDIKDTIEIESELIIRLKALSKKSIRKKRAKMVESTDKDLPT